MNTKTCTKCGETKPLDDFHRWARSRDGRTARCRVCVNEANLDYHRRNREARNAKMREYRLEHLDESKARLRSWYEANKDRHREIGRRWVEENRERRREIQNAYADRNRELVRERLRNAHASRRARIHGTDAEPIDRAAIIERDQGRCHFCGKKCKPSEIHLDHLVPLAHGGAHTAANVRVACATCNMKSGAGRLPAQLLLVG